MSRDRRGRRSRLSLEMKDRHAISEFRRRHVEAFEKLFAEVLRLASASGLLKVGRLALDGTKIKAFSEIASRHGLVSNRAMSYDRMLTEEARLQQEVRELLAQAEAEDQADDAQHGTNRRGDELPDELLRRESRFAKPRRRWKRRLARGRRLRTRRRTPFASPQGRSRSRSTSTTCNRNRRLNATSPTPTRRS